MDGTELFDVDQTATGVGDTAAGDLGVGDAVVVSVRADSSSWATSNGKGVRVHARKAHVRLAPAELRYAEKVIAELHKLVAPELKVEPIDIYLIDSLDLVAAGITDDADYRSAKDIGWRADGSAVLRVVRPQASDDRDPRPLVAALIAQWFGVDPASDPIVAGIAGVVAARAEIGLSIADADGWVQAEIDAGRAISVASLSSNFAATSFASSLIIGYGPNKLRKYVAKLDADRHDKAAIAAYQQPIGVLEETWIAAVKRRAGGQDAARALIPRLLPLLRPYPWRVAEMFVLLVLAAAYGMLAPFGIKVIYAVIKDGVAAKTAADTAVQIHRIDYWLIGLFGAAVLGNLVSLRRSYVVTWLNQKVLTGLQERLFEHLQRLPHGFYDKAKVGDIMARLTSDTETVQQAASQLTNKGLYQFFTLLGALAFLFWASAKSPLVILSVLVIAPLFYISFAALRARNKQASRDQRARIGQTSTVIQESISAHQVVKAFALEKSTHRVYRARIKGQGKSAIRLAMLGAMTDMSQDTATNLAQFLVLGFGAVEIIRGHMDAGSLAATLQVINKIFGPVSSLCGIGQSLQQASGAMDRVAELLDQPVTVTEKDGAVDLAPLSKEIRLEAVTFAYGGSRTVLDALDLTIPAGSNVAFVGPSGCGKSTTVSLLLRFWDPEAGRVLFDGQDIRDVTLASLRGQIGLVFQDTFVFDTTLRANIAIGRPDATDEEIKAAARAARLDSYIEALPNGYDNVPGERGARMSGGQRQRLALARAILRNPQVLILDEATSALDAKTEAEILDTLTELAKGRTTISITHRLSWAATADKIFVLDKGKVVEQGSHAELVKAGGLYQQLYDDQAGGLIQAAEPRAGCDIDSLRAVPLFADLSADSLSLLARRLSLERHPENTDVVKQGEPGGNLFVIGAGRVEVLVRTGESERRAAVLRAGDHFGEMELLTDEPSYATVRTIEPSHLFRLSRHDYEALMESEPTLSRTIFDTIAARRQSLAAILSNPDEEDLTL